MIKNLVKKFEIIFLLLALMSCTVCVDAFAAEIKGAAYDKNVLITGRADSLAGNTVSMLAVKKTASLDSLSASDIIYINDTAVSEDGRFKFPFTTTETISNIQVYVKDQYRKPIPIESLANKTDLIIGVDFETVYLNSSYNIKAAVENIYGEQPSGYDVIIAWYGEDESLISVEIKDSSELSEDWVVTVPEGAVRSRLYVWEHQSLIPQCPAVNGIKPISSKTYDVETFIPATDDVFYYSGRWQEYTVNDETHKVSNWSRPYIRIAVDGKKSIKFKFADHVGYDIGVLYVNGVEKNWHFNVPETEAGFDIKNYLTDGKVNDVMFMFKRQGHRVEFRGVTVEADTTLYVPEEKELNMMFIGDSITEWNYYDSTLKSGYSYSFHLPMKLNADFTTIARSAISLADPIQYYTLGMNEQFLNYGSYNPGITSTEENTGTGTPSRTAPYDFSKDDKFDLIFVNLGTNDYESSNTLNDAAFKTAYIDFLEMLKSKYPSAKIITVKPFTGTGTIRPWAQISAVFDAINSEYIASDTSGQLIYMDTTDWEFDYPTDYERDGLHPNETGHQKITEYMLKFLYANDLIN